MSGLRRALWAPLRDGLILDDLYVPMRLVLAGHRVGFAPQARAVDGRTFTARQEFRPRDYILENLTLERRSAEFLGFFEPRAGTAGPRP